MVYIQVGTKKLGVEFLFAQLSYFFTVYMQYFIIQRSTKIEQAQPLSDILEQQIPLETNIQSKWELGYDVILFWFVAVYEIVIYFSVAMCNPGRIDQKSKEIINERFKKLDVILQQSKQDPDNFLPNFESQADALLYNNYFLPCDLINSQNLDERRFKYCNKCEVYKLPRMHHCSVCNKCCVKYDHHCGLAINCIGINNYHIFIVFLHSTITFLLLSFLLNLKYTFLNYEFANQTPVESLLSIILLIHNPLTAYYNYALLTMYTKNIKRNIHAVEESIIGSTYDKARFHKIDYGGIKKFYFTRTFQQIKNLADCSKESSKITQKDPVQSNQSQDTAQSEDNRVSKISQNHTISQPNLWTNISEMMTAGGRGDPVLRWFLPFPYFNRQNYNDILNGTIKDNKEIDSQLAYMKFDKQSLRDLTILEYLIENKIEKDLIESGFNLKRRVQIPKCLIDLVGDIQVD
eukprot:403358582